jgi:hypothetical protein
LFTALTAFKRRDFVGVFARGTAWVSGACPAVRVTAYTDLSRIESPFTTSHALASCSYDKAFLAGADAVHSLRMSIDATQTLQSFITGHALRTAEQTVHTLSWISVKEAVLA